MDNAVVPMLINQPNLTLTKNGLAGFFQPSVDLVSQIVASILKSRIAEACYFAQLGQADVYVRLLADQQQAGSFHQM